MGTANTWTPAASSNPPLRVSVPRVSAPVWRFIGALTWLGCLTLAAMFICVRRLAGHVDRPLPPAGALFALTVVLVGMLAAQLLWTRDQRHRHAQAAFNAVALATLALWCGALLTGQPVWLWLTAAAVVAATGTKGVRNLFYKRFLTPFNLQKKRRRPRFVLQHELIRGRSSSGTDVLEGRVREVFTAGQRTAVVHLAFCPPFTQAPKLAVRQIGGPTARVKVGPLWPHGARLEVKLSQAAARASAVCLSLSARG